MVKVEYFKIQLDKPEGIFKPGDMVVGTISYKISKRGKINQVRLEAVGEGCVKCRTGDPGIYSYGHELFYEFKEVYETKVGDEDFYLEEGEYSHRFQFKLPTKLPSSVEYYGDYNRYLITGTIDIPWALNKNCSRIITVNSYLDLNLIPSIREPRKVTKSKTVCCWCCKSKPIVLTMTIRKGGYVAGETIYAEFTIENPTWCEIKLPFFCLYQVFKLKAKTITNTGIKVVARVGLARSVEANSKHTFSAKLEVPDVIPSTLNTARVVIVAYEVGILEPFDWPERRDITLVVPVVIGTTPVGDGDGQQQPAVNNSSLQPERMPLMIVDSDD